MYVQNFNGWNAATAVNASQATDAAPPGCQWAGIAIGPQSDEGQVLVGGTVLQAGRVLPLAANRYQITRVRGASVSNVDGLATIDLCQLLLFHTPLEFALPSLVRPNKTFESASFTSGITDPAGAIHLQFPFVGRRAMKIDFQTAGLGGDTWQYQVVGTRYNNVLGKPTAFQLKSQTGLLDPTANYGSTGMYSIYIGGTNDAEVWDAITVYLANTANPSPWTISATTYGEII